MKFIITIIITGLFYQSSLAQDVSRFYNTEIKVTEENVPYSESIYYFPSNLFKPYKTYNRGNATTISISDHNFDVKIIERYSKILFGLKEPLLYNKPFEKEIYRMINTNPDGSILCLRLEKEGEKCNLYIKNGLHDSITTKTVLNKSNDVVSISNDEWLEFKKILSLSRFWEMNFRRYPLDNSPQTEWIFEGNDKNNYRVVTRMTPGDNGWYTTYFTLCKYLVELSEKEDIEK